MVRGYYRHGTDGKTVIRAGNGPVGQKHDYTDSLKEIHVPVLVIQGAEDLQSEAASRGYVSAFPNAEFVVIENSGYFPHHDRPERFGRVIDEFLRPSE